MADIKIVGEADSGSAALELGAVDFLLKPFAQRRLAQTVKCIRHIAGSNASSRVNRYIMNIKNHAVCWLHDFLFAIRVSVRRFLYPVFKIIPIPAFACCDFGFINPG